MKGSEVSLARAIRGPVTLITVGILFALNNFTQYRFEQTWPVLLIIFGLLSLLKRSTDPVRQPPPPPPYNPPGANPAWQPGYRQSSYQDPVPPPPVETEKGGFGTSATPRPGDAGQSPSGEPV